MELLEGWELEADLLTIGVIEVLFDAQRHLIVKPYSLSLLHRAAEVLQIKRCWFHRNHYDIPKRRISWFDEARNDSDFYRKVSPKVIAKEMKKGN